MTKNKISRYLIFIASLTLLAIFTYIVQQSYQKLIGPIEKTQSGELSRPINPDIDLETINRLQSRQEYPPLPDAVIPSIATAPSGP